MDEQDYILFESYILGDLPETEKIAFETRLKTDTIFNESFNTYKELSSFLEHKISNDATSTAFQNNVKNISKAYFEKQETPKKAINFKPWQYAMAASVALLIGIVLFNNLATPSYSDYATHGNISLTVRGEQETLLQTAENAFNARDFVKAEEAFNSLMLIDGDNVEIQFYNAIANLELNDFETAEILLNNIKNGESAYKNKAIWYLALSKLKQNEHDACLEILKTIPEDAEDYGKAQKLIKKLD